MELEHHADSGIMTAAAQSAVDKNKNDDGARTFGEAGL